MKAILLSIHPEWAAKILNEKKSIEVRKTYSLYKAVNKLIEQYGYAILFMYCTKDNGTKRFNLFRVSEDVEYRLGWEFTRIGDANINDILDGPFNGKIVAMVICKKAEELRIGFGIGWETESIKGTSAIERASCMDRFNLYQYCNGKAYAFHTSNLVKFNKPKELGEFGLKRAPQSWQYVEVPE